MERPKSDVKDEDGKPGEKHEKLEKKKHKREKRSQTRKWAQEKKKHTSSRSDIQQKSGK